MRCSYSDENPQLGLSEFEIEYDPTHKVLWGYFHPQTTLGFTPKLLADIIAYDTLFIKNNGNVLHQLSYQAANYYIWASRTEHFYSAGGDLAYFKNCIEQQNRNALMHYATQCIDGLFPRIHNYFSQQLISIALVQGDALGGGFEAALASNVIIAEEHVKFSFPEIMFNLFPGMGAYSLLSRRIGSKLAEEIIFSGNRYSAARLFEMGLIDVVVPSGDGEIAVEEYVKKNDKRRNGLAAMFNARQTVSAITRSELMHITTVWVDAALRLENKDLRTMSRLVELQCRNNQIVR